MEAKSNEKISDRMLYKTLAISLLIILACMSAMALSAYAFFTSSVSTGTQSIISAYYELEITVKDASSQDVELTENSPVTLSAGTYTVTMKKTNTDATASTGFGTVSVNGGEKYYTQQIGRDSSSTDEINELTFSIVLNSEAEVTFGYSWGTSSKYGTNEVIRGGQTLTIN